MIYVTLLAIIALVSGFDKCSKVTDLEKCASKKFCVVKDDACVMQTEQDKKMGKWIKKLVRSGYPLPQQLEMMPYEDLKKAVRFMKKMDKLWESVEDKDFESDEDRKDYFWESVLARFWGNDFRNSFIMAFPELDFKTDFSVKFPMLFSARFPEAINFGSKFWNFEKNHLISKFDWGQFAVRFPEMDLAATNKFWSLTLSDDGGYKVFWWGMTNLEAAEALKFWGPDQVLEKFGHPVVAPVHHAVTGVWNYYIYSSYIHYG